MKLTKTSMQNINIKSTTRPKVCTLFVMFITFGLAWASTSKAAIITVDSLADPSQVAIDGNCTLREAIIAVNVQAKVDQCLPGNGDGDTVVFATDLAGGQISQNNKAMVIKRPLEIDGGSDAGITINGNYSTSILRYQDRLTVNNLTFQFGQQAIAQDSVTQVSDPLLNVYNSTFNYNDSTTDGGAIFASTVFVSNSEFTGNEANNGNGGAIYFSSTATIVQSYFSGNHATAKGGAIGTNNFLSPADQLTIKRSLFVDNSADTGGAVSFTGDTLQVADSSFRENNAEAIGGAVNVAALNSNIQRVVFRENYVRDLASYNPNAIYGAAIHLTKKDTSSHFIASISNSQFIQNAGNSSIISVYGNGLPSYDSAFEFESNTLILNQNSQPLVESLLYFDGLKSLDLDANYIEAITVISAIQGLFTNSDICGGNFTGTSITARRNLFDKLDGDCGLNESIADHKNVYESADLYKYIDSNDLLCYRKLGNAEHAECIDATIGLNESNSVPIDAATYRNSGFERGGQLLDPMNADNLYDIRGFNRFYDIVGEDYDGEVDSIADIGAIEEGETGNWLSVETPVNGTIKIAGKNMIGSPVTLNCNRKRGAGNCLGLRSLKSNPWTLTAIPKPGYEFVRWSNCNTSTLATITVQDATQENTSFHCEAEFAPQTFTINVNNSTGGSVMCLATNVSAGESTMCRAEPDAGYRFVEFSNACDRYLSAYRCAFDHILADKNVIAVFAPGLSVKVTIIPADAGSLNCSQPLDSINSGDSISCTPVAKPGYSFDTFSGDCQGAAPCDINNITSNQSIVVNFIADAPNVQYDITKVISPAGAGSLTCTPDPIPSGQSSTCNVSVNNGYTYLGMQGDCTTTDTTCTLTNVTDNQSITALFAANGTPTYAVTEVVTPAAGGSLSCSPNPVTLGQSSTCQVSVNNGYTYLGMQGDCTTTDTTCTLTNITDDREVTATFTPTVHIEEIFSDGFE